MFGMKRYLKYTLWLILLIVIGGFLIFFINALVKKVISDLTFATGILAIATVIMAFFTYWSIRSNNEKEKRDRKERLLREIEAWANDCFVILPLLMGKGGRKDLFDCVKLLTIPNHGKKIIEEEAKVFNIELTEAVKQTGKDMGDVTNFLLIITTGNLDRPLLKEEQSVFEDKLTLFIHSVDHLFEIITNLKKEAIS
jgi:hypothetical protein